MNRTYLVIALAQIAIPAFAGAQEVASAVPNLQKSTSADKKWSCLAEAALPAISSRIRGRGMARTGNRSCRQPALQLDRGPEWRWTKGAAR